MLTKQQHSGNIRVEEYSLAAWLAEVETVINQGYKFNFESNEGYPTGFGSMYTAVLVPVTAKTEVLFGKKEITAVATDVAPSATLAVPLVETPVVEVKVEPTQTKRKYNKG